MTNIRRMNTYMANLYSPYVDNEAVRDRYENIMKGLRIWHYFEVVFRSGDVSFHLQPADLVDAVQPITPKEEILETLFAMAEEISENLPPDEDNTDKYMFNRY